MFSLPTSLEGKRIIGSLSTPSMLLTILPSALLNFSVSSMFGMISIFVEGTPPFIRSYADLAVRAITLENGRYEKR